MTRDEARKFSDILRAYAEGTPIQKRARHSHPLDAAWVDIATDDYKFAPQAFEYRVTPPPPRERFFIEYTGRLVGPFNTAEQAVAHVAGSISYDRVVKFVEVQDEV